MKTTTKTKSLYRSAASEMSRTLGFVLGLLMFLQAGALLAQVPERNQSKTRTPSLQVSPVGTTFRAPDILNVPEGMTARQFATSLYEVRNNAQRSSSANPDLPADLVCSNLDVIFVLDESGSIDDSEESAVENGALEMLQALNNTGANIRIIEFATTASVVNLGVTEVNNTLISRFTSYLTSSYNSQSYNPVSANPCTGWTNWEDALNKVAATTGDLVLFFTDGNPTAYNQSNGNCSGGTVQAGTSNSTSLSKGVTAANAVKAQGKHMFGIGVGTDLNVSNLQAISGNDNFANNGDIFTDDYSVGNFNDIADQLTAAVNVICGTELSLVKSVNLSGVCSGEQVIFTITVTNTGGNYDYDAINVVVSDVFPNGFSNLQIVAPAPAGSSISGNTLTYNAGNLAADQSASIQIRATVGVPPANFNNNAVASADNADEVTDGASVIAGYATETLVLSDCDPVTVNQQVYSSTATYQQQLTSAAGCDSILTINYTRLQNSSSQTFETACDSYLWNGTMYTTSGAYIFNTTNAAGCDSVATLNLTINNSTSSYTAETACISFVWMGNTFSQSGIYVIESTNNAGCPNLDTLELTVISQPEQPAVECYQTATWNLQTCSWDVTGDMPAQPQVACYETATFNTTSCEWDVTGDMPAQPRVACYQTATFNTTSCEWDVTGDMPAQPQVACYETATFNTTSCEWDVTGDMPAQPQVACYETATFNTTSCEWDVTGNLPALPQVACYETATFNTTSCEWDVTGDMPAQPQVACYQTATFNTTSCEWDVTGDMPAQPQVACYETATFNTTSCEWDVTGDMPAQPQVACYETATFNTTSCEWDVTGDMPAQPQVACYETATFNTTSCEWDVTGDMPAQPQVACYETATFNTTSCEWDVTGDMPAQPQVACYETATFNTTSCEWDVTGDMPAQPQVACYETATFNTTSCAWDVTGDMPAEPETSCFEYAVFNSNSCSWDIFGGQPPMPVVACYETATFNTISCEWDVTGDMPNQPEVACYETATFNTTSCAWDVTGDMPAQPQVACYETATFNTTSCAWDVTGDMPAQPQVACYETATFNTTSCAWDVTGDMPAQPQVACYETATFNTTSCTWDVTGDMPAQPVLEDYQTATFNHETCTWDITGNPPSGCYAVDVYAFNQGLTKLGTAVNAERSFPTNALGAPNGQNPAIYAPVQNFVSLGFGGSIELDFGYGIANGPGNDIKIWESSASPNMEKAQILVSQDGLGYLPVGIIQQGGEVDFGSVFSDYIRFVKILDVSDLSDFSNNQISDGYDVDAIECIHGRYVNPSCVAVDVVSYKQGKQANGEDVAQVRSDVNNALDLPVATPVGVVNFYSLGFGGEITLAFDGPVANGPGADVRIVETTWNFTAAQYPETANVFASQDGVNFVYLGSTVHSGEFDFGPLTWAQYIKIMDASDASLFPANADGYDVNGIECLNGSKDNPGDDGLVPCVLTDVLSYNPGSQKNGGSIHSLRNDPDKALGAPQGNDTYNFVSLGFGGSIELGFDFVVFNKDGNDIQVIETSFGNPTCVNYPEHAQVAGSIDGVSWVDLGELCLDGTIDLGSMTFLQFVRITDISNSSSSRFGGTADGFDVDAVVVLGECYNASARYAADNTTTPDESAEMGLYPNPADDFTVIRMNGSIQDELLVIEVFDAAGRLVYTETVSAQANQTNIRLSVVDFAKGVYTVSVSTSRERLVQRLVK
jgi:uncharacterized repeat protein (TIGR01451 family)